MRHLANLKFLLVSLLALLTVPSFGGEKPVSVTVLDGTEGCSVLGRTTPCSEVGRLLKDKLSVASNRPITVMVKGSGEGAERRGKDAAAVLRASGFNNLTVVGFLTEPSARAP
ncbi:MAG TPA: hypothetical protein VK624_05835 [Steroidobacteraceae bacterium]|nr:hypothetical protein [Steroidobacteraceae bacterium]